MDNLKRMKYEITMMAASSGRPRARDLFVVTKLDDNYEWFVDYEYPATKQPILHTIDEDNRLEI